jgi:hypothetical protein
VRPPASPGSALGLLPLALGLLCLAAAPAEAGHEIPFYPSFYPQEITLDILDPAAAAAQLKKKLHAYLGPDPFAGGPPPANVVPIESLRSYLVVTFEPSSRAAAEAAGRCAAAGRLGRSLTASGSWMNHPYPVTPFHPDYLQHFDLVEAAKRRLGAGGQERPSAGLKLKAKGLLAQELTAAGWTVVESGGDAVVEEVQVADLLAAPRFRLTGWPGPAEIRNGWFQAYLLHAPSLGDSPARRTTEELLRRRVTGLATGATERLNLERKLVTTLTRSCERVVLGYGVKRDMFNAEYSEGIENVAHDPQSGLSSAIFIRTAKLKDFPWNGWLRVGVAAAPSAAWNPVGGFTDPTGGFLWAAIGDPAFLPSPYDGGWVANRVTATVTAEASVAPDAVLPEPGTGLLKPVGPGATAASRVSYRVLTSAFHDGTKMGVADLLYPFMFAARWSAPERRSVGGYDPVVDRATAQAREWLAGLRVVRVDKDLKDFGEVKLFYDIPQIEVYLRQPGDEARAAAIAAPWSAVPWHLLALMEEAVTRGLGAFSEQEARRRGIPWLDLARNRKTTDALAGLASRFEQQGFVPEPLRKLVTTWEARQRWAQFRRFYRQQGHLLVTNGPYRLDRWSPQSVVLQVFRDLTYPLGVGTFDRFALPLRASVEKIERQGNRLVLTAEVERVAKVQRTLRVTREPLERAASGEKSQDVPVCHYVVVGADGEVVSAGTSQQLDAGRLVVDLGDGLKPGSYRVLLALAVNGNIIKPEVKMVPYTVAAG